MHVAEEEGAIRALLGERARATRAKDAETALRFAMSSISTWHRRWSNTEVWPPILRQRGSGDLMICRGADRREPARVGRGQGGMQGPPNHALHRTGGAQRVSGSS